MIYPSTDYVFDGTKKGPYTESDEPNPLNAYGRTKLAGERATAHFNRDSFIVRTSWLFGPGRGELRRDDAAPGRGRRAGGRRPRPGRLPHLHRPPRRRPGAPDRRQLLRHPPHGGRGQLLVVRVRDGDLPPGRGGHARDGFDHRDDGAAPPSGPRTRCWAAAGRPRSSCPTGSAGSPTTWHAASEPEPEEAKPVRAAGSTVRRQPVLELHPRATRRRTKRMPRRLTATSVPRSRTATRAPRRRGRCRASEDPGHRRRRLHRLQLRAPPARGPPRRLGAGARQAHLRRPAREPRGAARRPSGVRRGRHRRPRRCPGRGRGLRRRRQLRRRVPRRPLDRVARRVHHHRRLRHLRAARGLPRRGHPPPAGLDRRGLRRPRRGHRDRGLAAGALLPLLRLEGRRRPARLGLRAHLRRRGADRPRLQQLRPPPAPREADPALHPQRPRGRPAAGLRRRHAGPQLALRRGLLRRDRRRARAGRARRASTTSAAPTSCPTSRSCSGSWS